jgi:hypothetical protein
MHADASIGMGSKRSVWSYGLIAAGAAAVANVLILTVGGTLGVPFEVTAFGQPGAQAITAVPVVISTMVSIALGTATAALIGPRFRNGFRMVQILVGILTVLSLGAPVNAAEGLTVVWLAAMHFVAGTALIFALEQAKEGEAA